MSYNTILLIGDLSRNKEKLAASAITPGDLIEFNNSTGKVQRHSTLNGNAMAMFAKENDLEGDDIDTDYAADELVQYLTPVSGDEVYAILAVSQTIKQGDFLVSAGNGKLKKFEIAASAEADYVHRIVAMAMEDKTTTAAVARIIVQKV